MSEANAAATPVTSPEMDKIVAEMTEKFNKKDKLVALPTDDQEAFINVVSSFGENVKDWTDGADQSVFTGLGLAKSDNGRIVLIPIASMEAVFSDPVVRAALYRNYVNKVINEATDNDAQASYFLTVAGLFKQKFDVDAFKFLAKTFVKFLRDQGLSGITIASLRQSFASAAFAKTQFPRTTDEQWTKILGMAKALAAKNGHDVSLFEHWEATRAVQTADTSVLNLDFAALQNMEDALETGEDETTAGENKPAAVPVPASA